MSKATRGQTLSKVKGVAKRVGPLGAVLTAVDSGLTYKQERDKGRTKLGATLATAAKVTSGIAGGIAGAAFGSGIASLATGTLGAVGARAATSNFIDKVFKPKNTPKGAVPVPPKKGKKITLDVGLNASGKSGPGPGSVGKIPKQKLVKP